MYKYYVVLFIIVVLGHFSLTLFLDSELYWKITVSELTRLDHYFPIEFIGVITIVIIVVLGH